MKKVKINIKMKKKHNNLEISNYFKYLFIQFIKKLL